VRVGDDQLQTAQAALDQAAQEGAPERFRLGLADVERDHLAVAGLVHTVGQHQRFPHDPAAVADLLDLRVQPQIGVAALQRAVAERIDLLVEAGADPRDLTLRDPQPERLDHLIDLARGNAGDVRLLHHAHQSLLAAPARLEAAREVRAAAELRDRQLELARPRRPTPRAVAVAVRQPLRCALAPLGADQLRHLCLHQLLHDPGKRLAQEIQTLALEQVADDLLGRHPHRLGHRGDSPLVVVFAGLDESERHGGRTNYPARPMRSYTTLRDVTGLTPARETAVSQPAPS
jgi:hypothetical protein